MSLILCLSVGCSQRTERKEIRVGIDSTWTPWNFGTQTPFVNGFVEDLLLAMSHQGKICFEKIPANWDTLFEGLEKGRYDVVLTSLPAYNFNEAVFDFSKNFLSLGPVFAVDAKSSYRSLEKMLDLSFGFSGDFVPDAVRWKYPMLKILLYPSNAALLEALERGDVAAVLIDAVALAGYFDAGALKIISDPLTNQGLHFAKKKGGKKHLMPLLDSRLADLTKKKKVQELLKKWHLSLKE